MSGEFRSLTEIAFHGREVALNEVFFPLPELSLVRTQAASHRKF